MDMRNLGVQKNMQKYVPSLALLSKSIGGTMNANL